MSTNQTWQDAVVEAMKELTPDNKRLEFDAHVTVYPSKSDPRGFYYVLDFGKFMVRADGKQGVEARFERMDVTVCTCRGFRMRDSCSHVNEWKKETGR